MNQRYWQNSITLLRCLVLLAGLMSAVARSELVIEITQGRIGALPIAVIPFGEIGGDIPVDIAEVAQNDLLRSGQFKPLPRSDMLSTPTTEADIIYYDWRVLGTEYLVTGNVSKSSTSDSFAIEFGLYDVFGEKKLWGETVTVSSAGLRKAAHYVADRVYERLTGQRSAFSTKIVYVTVDRSGEKTLSRLWYADADGYNPKEIIRSHEPILSPTWSPDGKQIAYVSFDQGQKSAIYIQDIVTGKRRKVAAFKGHNGAPDFSPDGRRLAMALSRDNGNYDIYVMDLATGDLERITRHYGIDTEPRWLTDGKHLVFTSNRSGSPQIYQVNVDTREVERLTFVGNYNARPAVTPDGKHLVMVHRDRSRQFHIAVQNLEKGSFSIITDTELDESPSVAPNGSMLIYATLDQNNKSILAVTSIDGQVKVRLPSREGEVQEPAWSPFL